jgi:hypothetical protein
MTDKEQADYNEAFFKSFNMNVGGIPDKAIEFFLQEDSDDEFYEMYGSEYYTPLADARGVFWNGYELGLKQCMDQLKRNGVI